MTMTLPLTALAMLAFAANSLLARAALGGGAIDAASFTAIRLCSGALALGLLILAQRRRTDGRVIWGALPGDWISAAALFAYAIGFSLAYLRLGAATGALILFAAVQATMLLWGLARRDRPGRAELAGLAIAFAAFVYLLLPGARLFTAGGAPDPLGGALMTGAGIAWGVYSLRGRGVANPLGATAGNFLRAAPMCLLLALLPMAGSTARAGGIGLALASGVVASGLGYAVWYRALPHLRTVQAATVQLTVPLIAAIGAVAVLGETLTARVLIAGPCLLGGVAVAILARRPARPPAPHRKAAENNGIM
jgi:drug/metabolite transporter (DMT)-like permease